MILLGKKLPIAIKLYILTPVLIYDSFLIHSQWVSALQYFTPGSRIHYTAILNVMDVTASQKHSLADTRSLGLITSREKCQSLDLQHKQRRHLCKTVPLFDQLRRCLWGHICLLTWAYRLYTAWCLEMSHGLISCLVGPVSKWELAVITLCHAAAYTLLFHCQGDEQDLLEENVMQQEGKINEGWVKVEKCS